MLGAMSSQAAAGHFWSEIEHSLVCRVAGCVVRSGTPLVATCFAMRQRLRRENASSNWDLFSAAMSPYAREVDVCVSLSSTVIFSILGALRAPYRGA